MWKSAFYGVLLGLILAVVIVYSFLYVANNIMPALIK